MSFKLKLIKVRDELHKYSSNFNQSHSFTYISLCVLFVCDGSVSWPRPLLSQSGCSTSRCGNQAHLAVVSSSLSSDQLHYELPRKSWDSCLFRLANSSLGLLVACFTCCCTWTNLSLSSDHLWFQNISKHVFPVIRQMFIITVLFNQFPLYFWVKYVTLAKHWTVPSKAGLPCWWRRRRPWPLSRRRVRPHCHTPSWLFRCCNRTCQSTAAAAPPFPH